jgi:hypothetical protein
MGQRSFGHLLKARKKESSWVAPLRQTDGTLHSNPHIKADILNKFKSVFTTCGPSFAKALFFCLVNLRVVVSIQGLVCRDLVCLCGTCLSRSLSMLSLKEVHMSFMVENGVAVNLLIYAVTSVLNSVILAIYLPKKYSSSTR